MPVDDRTPPYLERRRTPAGLTWTVCGTLGRAVSKPAPLAVARDIAHALYGPVALGVFDADAGQWQTLTVAAGPTAEKE
jgi:hypothetical protein